MGTDAQRAKGLESVISACLLAVLFLIGLGVFLKQSRYDSTAFGPDTTAKPPAQKPKIKTTAEPDLQALAPEGFHALSDSESYGPDDLYEKINGKASLYHDSGFRRLFTRRFAHSDNPDLWAELYVYDMETVKNAFSVFSLQRRPDTDILPPFEPLFGYATENAVYFVKGHYYVEFIGSAESPELIKGLTGAAAKIETDLPVDQATEIQEFGLFVPENMIPGSIKLSLTNAFGCAQMTDTFSARYKLGDQTVTAFLSRRADSSDAKQVAQGYYNWLIENGGTAKAASAKPLQGRIVDFYETTEIVFAAGQFVGGIHGADNQQAAEKLAVTLMNRLTKAAKVKRK